jgi:hypothetical protein
MVNYISTNNATLSNANNIYCTQRNGSVVLLVGLVAAVPPYLFRTS